MLAPRFVTPLPGVVIERSQTTTNVQSVTSTQLRESQAVNVTDYLGTNMQSVNVNDYSGNPFQQDLVFRGFSASPLIGTPQGLSVYLDGVRVNEPFGEVVNWDLIPVNAIQRMELMPGSDPLFGLNTLGGALAITTKSGFTAPRGEIKLLGGSWGRKQAQVSLGGQQRHGGRVPGASTSSTKTAGAPIRRATCSRSSDAIDIQGRRVAGGISYLFADNTLVGNGLVPYEQYLVNPQFGVHVARQGPEQGRASHRQCARGRERLDERLRARLLPGSQAALRSPVTTGRISAVPPPGCG